MLNDVAHALALPLGTFFEEETAAAPPEDQDLRDDTAEFARQPQAVRRAVLALLRDLTPNPDPGTADATTDP